MANPKATKLPSGKWRARAFDSIDDQGKRHYVSFTADTKTEAQLAARMHVPMGRRVNIPYPELTLSEAYRRYIDSHRNEWSPSTVREYTNASKRELPSLMPMKLKDITPELVQTAINEAAAGHSPKTVRDTHGRLHKVLKMYAPNIKLSTDFPKKKKPEIYVPTTDEVLKALEHATPALRVPILLASNGSLRRSEICALTPEDFTDFGVHIKKAMVKNDKNEWVIKQPKTAAGYRFCPLPPDVIREAKEYRYIYNPDQIENRWQRLKGKIGVDFRFHAFRHYWASLMHAQGLPDHYIMATGGWSSIQILHNVYAHAMRDKVPEFNNQIVEIITKEFFSRAK